MILLQETKSIRATEEQAVAHFFTLRNFFAEELIKELAFLANLIEKLSKGSVCESGAV